MRDQTITCQRCRHGYFRDQVRPDGLMVDLVCASCGWPVQGMEKTIETHRWFEACRQRNERDASWTEARRFWAKRR